MSNGPPFVFIGDSITAAWRDHPFFTMRGYVRKGVGGETSDQILARVRSDVLALRPSAVHILAGTNDIAQNRGPVTIDSITANITELARLANASAIEVYIGSVLPADDYWWYPGVQPSPKIKHLNAMLAECSLARGFRYVDYYSALIEADGRPITQYLPDGVHPSTAGYAMMEKVFDRCRLGGLQHPKSG